MADFYNKNLKANGGRLEAVYNIKKGRDVGDYVEGAAVQDEENSVLAGIKEQPWQTDASIGTWFFVPDLEPKWRRTGPDVIVMLADIVAKNGNLLLNIPQRGDGTIDAEAEQVLAELAAWMKVNGEAIFATRPWKILGEGPACPPRVAASKGDGLHRRGHPLHPVEGRRDALRHRAGLACGRQAAGRALARDSGRPDRRSVAARPFRQTRLAAECERPRSYIAREETLRRRLCLEDHRRRLETRAGGR